MAGAYPRPDPQNRGTRAVTSAGTTACRGPQAPDPTALPSWAVSDDLSTFGVTHPGRDDGPVRIRNHRLIYATTTVLLTAVMVLAVADCRGPVLGVDTAVVTERLPDGVVLAVEYPEVTRPALASPFSIEVSRPGGFSAPIELAVSRSWIEAWDENGFYPTPSAETGDPEWVVYEFDPPDGERFRFFYDARLEPARQSGLTGAVELREAGDVVAAVEFETAVRP